MSKNSLEEFSNILTLQLNETQENRDRAIKALFRAEQAEPFNKETIKLINIINDYNAQSVRAFGTGVRPDEEGKYEAHMLSLRRLIKTYRDFPL